MQTSKMIALAWKLVWPSYVPFLISLLLIPKITSYSLVNDVILFGLKDHKWFSLSVTQISGNFQQFSQVDFF